MNPLKHMLDVAHQYRIEKGKDFRLKNVDPADTAGLKSEFKKDAQVLLQQGAERLGDLQDKLYAQNRWALLVIFQAMDAAGKDSTIKHVMSGVNPQGVDVSAFKQPSSEELDHDYMWRCLKRLPERGKIGIFNRSYYEEVLVVKVHPEYLKGERIPEPLTQKHFWQNRYEDINNIERYLARNGIAVCKFFLHVSQEEQKKRFLKRLEEPEKNWKFSAADVKEREHWDDYQSAYEKMVQETSAKHAPWYVVPADHKWFTRMVVSAAITQALLNMNLEYPTVSSEQRILLDQAKRELEQEKL
jgi:PPK2 family polyphosphate:nucleotide phosphotransferase